MFKHNAQLLLLITLSLSGSLRGEAASTAPSAGASSMRSYQAHIAAAAAAIELNDPSAAHEWLDNAPDDHRGFEYHFLRASLDHSIARLATCSSDIWRIAISPDGQRIAAATNDGVVELFDSSGKSLKQLKASTSPLYRVAFSADGKLIAAGGADRVARVWNAATAELLHELTDLKTPITGIAFSPDGKFVMACNYTQLDHPPHVDGTVVRWNLSTGAPAGEIRGIGRKPLSGIALSPDGKQLVAGSWNGELYVCDVEAMAVKTMIELPRGDIYNAVNAVAWSPDGKWLACGGKDHIARVYDATTNQLKHTLRHGGWVTSVLFTHESDALITTSADEQTRIWGTSTGTLTAVLRGHRGGVTSAVVTDDGRHIISCGQDKALLKFSATQPNGNVRTWTGPPGTYGLSFVPDGSEIIVNGYDGTLRRYNASTTNELQSIKAHEKSSNWSALSADGQRLVTCSWDKSIRLWHGTMWEQLLSIDVGATAAYGCAISPDGTLIAGAFGDNTAKIYDAATGTLFHELRGHTAALHEVAFSADGRHIATAATDGTARVWSVDSGECVAILSGHTGSVEAVAFHPAGEWIATAATDGTAALWNPRNGAKLWQRKISTRGLQRLGWSPDGTRLAVGGDKLYLIEPETGAVVLRCQVRAGDIYNLKFDSSGNQLAMCSADGWIALITSAPSPQLLPTSQPAQENKR